MIKKYFGIIRKNLIKKQAFTLAEVLITLGVIGVVAAFTLPTLVGNYQKSVMKNQFKKTYATLNNAWTMTVATLGYEPECYYWEGSPYGGATCKEYNASGDCTGYQMADGSSLPSDYNGRFADCTVFAHELLKNLKTIKTCQNRALAGGCIPEYEGNDTLYKKNNNNDSDYDANKATSGCGNWRKSAIASSDSAHILADGQIILGYGYFSANIFAVDINGMKGPNKWGYDLFGFQSIGNVTRPLHIGSTGCMPIDKGGTYSTTMVQNFSAK